MIAADPAIASDTVLAVAETLVSADARRRHSVQGRSLFDLPLGDQRVYRITEEPVTTTAPSGREERVTSVLPAWSAETTLDLGDERLGFPTITHALARAIGVDALRCVSAQSTTARYGAVGFEAAAVTGMYVAVRALRTRPGLRRSATMRFAHPYAVVAATTSRPGQGDPAPGIALAGTARLLRLDQRPGRRRGRSRRLTAPRATALASRRRSDPVAMPEHHLALPALLGLVAAGEPSTSLRALVVAPRRSAARAAGPVARRLGPA